MQFTSLVETIAWWAKQTPDKVCLIDADCDRNITYGTFWRQIRIFARRLRDMGLSKGDRVVVRVGPLIETFVAQFGIYLAGGVYCPVEKHMKELKTLEMLDYFAATLLVSSERVTYSGQWIDLNDVCSDGEPLENFVLPNPEDMCAIVFTTGTTGKAKGVMINYKTCRIHAETWKDVFRANDQDVFFWTNPLDRVVGIRIFGLAFLSGGTVVHYTEVVFIKNCLEIIYDYNVSIMYTEPFTFGILMNGDRSEFIKYMRQIRAVFFSGSVLSDAYKQQIKSLLPDTNIYSYYSSTEICLIASYDFSNINRQENCVGKPFESTKIYILDDEGKPMQNSSRDNPGIIACASECAMMGYWNEPGPTAGVLHDGMVSMTDIGYMDSEGYLYVLGRRDDVIVSGGHKIAPYEIENVAMHIPGILECACVPARNSILGSVPKLFVVMKDGCEFSVKEISEFLASRLETFKIPRIIRVLDSLPRVNESQKIDRKGLANCD